MKSCKLGMRVKFNILAPTNIFHWFPASPTYSHLGTVSSSHGLYRMGILAKHIQVWNQDSVWYGVKVVQTTLQALFWSIISGVVVQDFRSSSVPVTRVI